jgi:hypothetical protein
MTEINIEDISNKINNYKINKTRLDEIGHSLMVRKTGLMTLLENNKDDTLKLHLDVINESFKREELELSKNFDKLELEMQLLLISKQEIKDKLKIYLNLLQNIDNVLSNKKDLDNDDLTDNLVSEVARNLYSTNKNICDEFIKREKEYHPSDLNNDDVSVSITKKVIRVNNDKCMQKQDINVVKSSNEYSNYSELNSNSSNNNEFTFFEESSSF